MAMHAFLLQLAALRRSRSQLSAATNLLQAARLAYQHHDCAGFYWGRLYKSLQPCFVRGRVLAQLFV
jgi:hypothetical protein